MLMEEVGELAKAVRQQVGLKFTDTTKRTDLREELADVQIVLLGLASMVDEDMFTAVQEKERKNSQNSDNSRGKSDCKWCRTKEVLRNCC